MEIIIEETDKCTKCGSGKFIDMPREYTDRQPYERNEKLIKQSFRTSTRGVKKPKKRRCLDCGNIYVKGSHAWKKPGRKPKNKENDNNEGKNESS